MVRKHRHKSVISTLKDVSCDAPLPVKKTANEQTALTTKTTTPEVATEAACRASRSAARQLRPGGPRRQPQGKQKHHDDGCKERGRRRAARGYDQDEDVQLGDRSAVEPRRRPTTLANRSTGNLPQLARRRPGAQHLHGDEEVEGEVPLVV